MDNYIKEQCAWKIHKTAKNAAKVGAGGSLLPSFIPGSSLFLHVAKRVPLAAIEIKMVIDLARIFGKEIDESLAQAILSAALATVGGKMVAHTIGDIVGTSIPIVGAVVGGATAAATVEAVGWAVVDLLDSGEF